MSQILIIGDTHIPDRAQRIPIKLLELIESGKPWEIVVFTGDFTGEETLNWVKTLGLRVYYVKGNIDYLPLPKTTIFEIDSLKIGIHHGDGVYPRGDIVKLSKIASSMNVDILITGHTHLDFVKTGSTGKELLLNPGSLTGVWGGGGGSLIPSFMIMEQREEIIKIYTYKLFSSKIAVEKHDITRIDDTWIINKEVSPTK